MYKSQELDAMRDFYLYKKTVFLPDIDEGIVGVVISDLARLAADEPDFINLAISSNGGITDDGFTIAQFIEFELGIPVHAQVFGVCDSAATYPLLTCKKRTGNELTTFVLHHQTAGITTPYGADFEKTATGWVEDNKKIHQKQVRFYSQKLGLPAKEAEAIMLRGSAGTNNKLSAQDALNIGLLTEVTKLSKNN
jgi:ATP-dependent protease ClpP protease subunit